MAHINPSHLKYFGWYSDGQLLYATMGAVSEHIEKLKGGDLVEFRSTGTYKTLKDFSTKQDGVAQQIKPQLRVLNRPCDENSAKSSRELVFETSAPQWARVVEAGRLNKLTC